MCNNGCRHLRFKSQFEKYAVSITKHFFFVKCNCCYLSDKIAKLMVSSISKIRQEKFVKNTRLAPAESWGQLSFVCYGNGESALAGRFNFSVLSYLHYICVRGWDLLSDISARTSLYWVTISAWVPNCSSHTHILKNDPSVRSFVNTAQKMWVHAFGFQKSFGKRTLLCLDLYL